MLPNAVAFQDGDFIRCRLVPVPQSPLIPPTQALHVSLSSASALFRQRGLVWTGFASVLKNTFPRWRSESWMSFMKKTWVPCLGHKYTKKAQTQPTLDVFTLRYTQASTRSLLHHISADRCVIKKHKTII